MKFNKNLLKEKWFSYTIALCSAVVLYMLLTHLSGILQFLKSIWNVGAPVFMAFVIAYVLGPLVEIFSKYVFYKVEKKKLRHTLSVFLAILSVVLSIVILAVALIPQVIDSVILFAGNLNGYVLSFQRLMRQLNSMALQHDLDLSQFISSSDELLQSITRILPENLNKIVNFSYSFGAKMIDWLISFILAIYLMMDQSRLKSGLGRLLHAVLPAQTYRSTASFWSRCNRILLQFIAFDVLDGIIIGLCNWVFMVIMGMPYVAIISVVVGVTNLAPTFGPMVGAIIGAFILVLVKPWYALVFLLFTAVLQTLDGYVIKPRLFGEQLGVSSVWILISLTVGGRLLGVPGILLAIPFAAIGDFIYHDYIIKRLEEQNAEHEKLKEASHEGAKAAGSFAAQTAVDLTAAAAAGVRSIVPSEDEPETLSDKAAVDASENLSKEGSEVSENAQISKDSEISGNAAKDVSELSQISEKAPISSENSQIISENTQISEITENIPKEVSEIEGISEVLEVPQDPDVRDLSESLTASEDPEAADLSGSSTASEVPEAADLSGSSTASEVPEAADLSESSTASEAPESPAWAEETSDQDAKEISESAQISENSQLSENSDTSENAEASDAQDAEDPTEESPKTVRKTDLLSILDEFD